MTPVSPQDIFTNAITLKRKTKHEKTIFFDLDETLVHCCDSSLASGPDVRVPVCLPNDRTVQVGINIRPFVKECLVAASKLFEVAVFTASRRFYADAVLDYLDPEGNLI
jgi:CTD small phosphatase-like protein 2